MKYALIAVLMCAIISVDAAIKWRYAGNMQYADNCDMPLNDWKIIPGMSPDSCREVCANVRLQNSL